MEEIIKKLFFEESLRQWHFEDILKEAKISRERANHFLKILLKQKLIARAKPKGKMPHYTANISSHKFRSEKRIYGLALLEKAGLFEHLNSLTGIKTAILFGSFSRGDWNKSSDIDLFVYGNAEDFEKGKMERKIKKEIQLFSYSQPKEIRKELEPKLIPNIAKGFSIKGDLDPFKIEIDDQK